MLQGHSVTPLYSVRWSRRNLSTAHVSSLTIPLLAKKGERKHNRLPGRDGGSGRALTVRNGFKVAMKKIKSRQKHNYYYLFKLATWNESGGLFLPGLGKLPSCVHPVVPLVGDSDSLSNICPANWQEIWKKCQMIRGYG
uniref:Uncharacterized protein n=1 Tax=Anguilla anguilla TaxID=7936 RepID=A0A0E9WZI6_ANGAN